MKVVWTPFARESLILALSRLATLNPAATDRTLDRLLALAESLTDFPRRGTPGRYKGTREITDTKDKYPHILIYRIEPQVVAILRVSPSRTMTKARPSPKQPRKP